MRSPAALIAAVVATGLSLGTGPRAEAQPPIRIGASLAQTGSFAALGQSQLRGYQLCVKHANEQGGVLGRGIELLVEDVILKMDLHTVFGAFKVDRDGSQIAHKVLMFQWQDGKKVIVWPEELAPAKARFPTPPWSARP